MSSPSQQRDAVVTISAPYGAGGSVVGPRLAERLGVPFVDRAIPAAVSRRLDMPLQEALAHDQLTHRMLSRWMSYLVPAAQVWAGATMGVPTPAEEQSFLEATEAALREYAARGGVILGRAGAIVLRDARGALHVRLDGPDARRVRQAMKLEGVDQETAQREMRASDVARHAYVQNWYRVDPRDPRHYHLVIDSTSITLDGCVELIVQALGMRADG